MDGSETRRNRVLELLTYRPAGSRSHIRLVAIANALTEPRQRREEQHEETPTLWRPLLSANTLASTTIPVRRVRGGLVARQLSAAQHGAVHTRLGVAAFRPAAPTPMVAVLRAASPVRPLLLYTTKEWMETSKVVSIYLANS